MGECKRCGVTHIAMQVGARDPRPSPRSHEAAQLAYVLELEDSMR